MAIAAVPIGMAVIPMGIGTVPIGIVDVWIGIVVRRIGSPVGPMGTSLMATSPVIRPIGSRSLSIGNFFRVAPLVDGQLFSPERRNVYRPA